MAAKNFDVKQFLLQRGEFVGLGVAGAIVTLLLILAAIKGFSSPGPHANAEVVAKSAVTVNNKLRSDAPSDGGTKILDLGPLAHADKGIEVADSDVYRPAQLYFFPKGLSDMKRRGVNVMAPTEFRFAVAHAQLRAYQLVWSDGRPRSQPPDQIVLIKGGGSGTMGAGGSGSPMPSMPSGPASSQSGPLMPGSGGSGKAGGFFSGSGYGAPPSGAAGYMGGYQPQESSDSKATSLKVKLSELHLQKYAGMRFAEDVMPVRMVIVSGSFPFKKQLEEYVNKLQYATLTDLFRDQRDAPTFLGLEVQRVECGPDGKPLLDSKGRPRWETVDVEKALKYYVLLTGKRFEQEDPKLAPLLGYSVGLVMYRPVQFQEGKYPTPEKDLPALDKTMKDLKALIPEFKPKNPFDGSGLDIYNPGGPVESGMGGMGGMGSFMPSTPAGTPTDTVGGTAGGGMGGMTLGQQQLQQIPEYIPVRFIDVTVQPGKSYNYQVRIKMKNPNYGREKEVAWKSLADDKEIKSDFVLVKDDSNPDRPIEEQARVSVGSEAFIYSVDQAALDGKSWRGQAPKPLPDQAVVQIHRWMDSVQPDPASQVRYPVGDWVVAERLMLNRGEYLTRTDRVEVPVWNMLDEKFGLMMAKKDKRGTDDKKVPVTFNMDQGQGDQLLVDFQGGDVSYKKLRELTEDKNLNKVPVFEPVSDKAPSELMFLTPSGKLTVHSSESDAEDQARKDRLKEYKDRMAKVKESGPGGKPADTNPFGGSP